MTTKTTDACGPQWLEYTLGTSRVQAFSTQRAGGVGRGSYADFNINPYCGDDPAAVAENRALLARRMGIGPTQIILPHQTHGTEVRVVDAALCAQAEADRQPALEGIDALITDVCDVCVGVSTADCIPLLLYDAAHHAAGVVHAGWRGTVGRIAERAVRRMTETYGTCPAQLRAVIGPGISAEAFEVGDEVYDAFRAAGFPMADIASRRGKWHIDLWAANFLQLEAAGLTLDHIHVSGICTYTHTDLYFSARRLGTQSGRIFTGIRLLP